MTKARVDYFGCDGSGCRARIPVTTVVEGMTFKEAEDPFTAAGSSAWFFFRTGRSETVLVDGKAVERPIVAKIDALIAVLFETGAAHLRVLWPTEHLVKLDSIRPVAITLATAT